MLSVLPGNIMAIQWSRVTAFRAFSCQREPLRQCVQGCVTKVRAAVRY